MDIVVSTKTKTVPILVFPVLFGKYRNKSSNSCPWSVESSVSAGGKALRSPDCLAERRRISIRDRMTALPSKVKSLLFNTFVVRLSLACRRRSGGCVGGHFWDTRHRWPGLGLLAPLSFPLPAGGAPADASVGIFGMRGIVGRGWDCLAPLAFPLPAGGVPARTGKYRTAVFLLCGATSSKLSCPA